MHIQVSGKMRKITGIGSGYDDGGSRLSGGAAHANEEDDKNDEGDGQ
jgi:hypothetical protein